MHTGTIVIIVFAIAGAFGWRAISGYFVQAQAAAVHAEHELKTQVANVHAALSNGKRNTLYAAVAVVLIVLGYYLGAR